MKETKRWMIVALYAVAMAWVVHGFRSNSWNHAFKMLRK